jgi:hypothetical protein
MQIGPLIRLHRAPCASEQTLYPAVTLKGRLYLIIVLFLRAFPYFVYAMLLRLGVLDGRRGLMFQGCWYRQL